MKNSKKIFVFLEAALTLLLLLVVALALWEKKDGNRDKVSVIVPNSDDNQWAALKYGMRMAAEDQGIEIFIVSTAEIRDAKEERDLIKQEIEDGADAVIAFPVPGEDTEGMLKKLAKKVPISLVESQTSTEGGESSLPIAEPDHYAMGQALAQEIRNDYNDNIDGKTVGLYAQAADSEGIAMRAKGFLDALAQTGAELRWTVSGPFDKDAGKQELEAQPKVDFVVALDDDSLTAAGASFAGNDLHGALIYGIGNSTEAVYYLHTGAVECLVAPDEFNVGYRGLTEIAQKCKHHFYKPKDVTASYSALRQEGLFSSENLKILFTISQ